jgi:hypothetical protein
MNRPLDNRRQWFGSFARWLAMLLLGGGGTLLARRNGTRTCRAGRCGECSVSATCTAKPKAAAGRQRR